MHIYYTSLLYTQGKIDVNDRMRHEMIHVHWLATSDWNWLNGVLLRRTYNVDKKKGLANNKRLVIK